ncbi:MAG: phosphatidylglycerophosphatase A [Acholeplasmataceae bacterium]|nr:phosphatidylglycerophosphatase A [Acholeplasmataceae bacterium]
MIEKYKEENRMNDVKRYDIVVERLEARGVRLEDMAQITLDLQIKYLPKLTFDLCLEHVKKVIMKREVQNAVLTGLELDELAEKGLLSEPLSEMLLSDYGLYGIDEVLALAIVNVYGSIGFTNFGYVDKTKPGIIGILDKEGKEVGKCNTFLDDIVGAISAAAASSIAHRFAQ